MSQPNILVDGTGNARITDFGLSFAARGPDTGWCSRSARWAAPEVLMDAKYGKGSDVFSYGMVVIEVGGRPTPSQKISQPHLLVKAFTGKVPFSELISSAVAQRTLNGERPERPTHSSFTDRLWALTQQCWRGNQQGRPRMDQVVQQLSVLSPKIDDIHLVTHHLLVSLSTCMIWQKYPSMHGANPTRNSSTAWTRGVTRCIVTSQDPG